MRWLLILALLAGCGYDAEIEASYQAELAKKELVAAREAAARLDQRADGLSRQLTESRNESEDKDTTVSVATVLLAGFSAALFVAVLVVAREVHGRRRFRSS